MTSAARADASRTAECSTAAHSDGPARSARRGAGDGGVDRLGAPRGEDDLTGPHADERGHPIARLFDAVAGGAALLMHAAGVAGCRVQLGHHGGAGLGAQREVDAWSR